MVSSFSAFLRANCLYQLFSLLGIDQRFYYLFQRRRQSATKATRLSYILLVTKNRLLQLPPGITNTFLQFFLVLGGTFFFGHAFVTVAISIIDFFYDTSC